MPPCAATVWLRVGNTLVMHAVVRPGLREAERRAQAGAAGADDDDVVGVVGERVGRGHAADSERDAQHGEHADQGGRSRVRT